MVPDLAFELDSKHSFVLLGSSGKRAPSAYNKYVSEHLKLWRESHPDRPVKEAMSAVSSHLLFVLFYSLILPISQISFRQCQVAAQWRDAPENPNRGQEPKKRGKKVASETVAEPVRQSRRGHASSDVEHAESSE